jgi:membrane-associated phospholipid phosphatase
MDAFKRIDNQIFEILYSLTGQYPTLDALFKALASDYFVPVGIGITLFFLWFCSPSITNRISSQKIVLTSILHMALSSFFVLVINQFVFVDRPFVNYEISPLFYPPTDSSFPSNPAAGIFSIVIQFTKTKSAKLITLVVILFLAMAICRICVGVHYPSDILGGCSLAIICTPIIAFMARNTEPVQNLFLRKLRIYNLA